MVGPKDSLYSFGGDPNPTFLSAGPANVHYDRWSQESYLSEGERTKIPTNIVQAEQKTCSEQKLTESTVTYLLKICHDSKTQSLLSKYRNIFQLS